MSRERRREPRFPCRLPLTLRVGGAVQETISEDVSYRGVFAITDDPPDLRQLVSVTVRLPGRDAPMTTHAMAVFALERGNKLGRPPGAGLQFYAASREFKTAWESFIDDIRRRQSPPAPASQPRRFVRYRLTLAVKPESIDELVTLYTRDVSRGGMFLVTREPLEIGRRLAVEVVHPISGRVFRLDCVVRRTSEGPPPATRPSASSSTRRSRSFRPTRSS